MKAKDLQLIILVAVISLIASFILSGKLFSTPEDRSQTVETAEAISTQFTQPDEKYFNANSFNPAKEVQPGQEPNSNPFQSR